MSAASASIAACRVSVTSIHAPRGRRRDAVCGSRARAGRHQTARMRRGPTSAISRCRNGRQMASSVGLGGRSPGGRQGISGVSMSLAALQPDRCEHPVQIGTRRVPRTACPPVLVSGRAVPRSAADSAAGSPSANTRWLAVSRSRTRRTRRWPRAGPPALPRRRPSSAFAVRRAVAWG